jgi:hypothetical protein
MAYKFAIDQQRPAAPDEFAAQAQELGMATEVNRFTVVYNA